MTLHSLRHTFSTRADANNVGAFAQKALLGHSKLTMTDKYTHLSKETLKANLAGMEQYISRIKDTRAENKNKNSAKSLNLLTLVKK